MNISAAIIAGGKSQRMNGINKSLIKVNNIHVIRWQLLVIADIFDEYFSISKNQIIPELVNYPDINVSMGPISGIYSALVNSKNEYVFVFSCDSPFIQHNIIQEMIKTTELSKPQVLIPRHKNGIEPLHAIYHKSIIPVIEKNINNGIYKVRSMYPELNYSYFDIDNENTDKIFFNINYPQDIKIAEKYARNE